MFHNFFSSFCSVDNEELMEHSRKLIYKTLYIYGFDQFYDRPTKNKVFLRRTCWFILFVNNVFLTHLTCVLAILNRSTKFNDKAFLCSFICGVLSVDWQY